MNSISITGSPAVVIDNGSGTIKPGFSGDDCPRAMIPTVVGRFRYTPATTSAYNSRHVFIGDEALKKRGILRLRYPIDGGLVSSFDDMEKLWNYAFMNVLHVLPEGQPALLTDPLVNETNHEAMAQVAFESLNVKALNISNQAALALYATGRTTGVVLDSGDTSTHATPILNGVAIPGAALNMCFGGRDLADRFIMNLLETGALYLTRRDLDIVQDILRRHGYVSANYDKEMQSALSEVERPYTLPDGETIMIKKERFHIPEVLFQPHLHGFDTLVGVHSLVNSSICRVDANVRSQLYKNIVVAGGNTMFPGFVDRLKAEMVALAPANTTVSLVAPSDRHIATWLGGSILSSLSIFKEMLVTKEEYDEKGASSMRQRWL